MLRFLKLLFSQSSRAIQEFDSELEEINKLFEGKFLVEPLKTKIHRHRVFWVGRSQHDNNEIRIGIEFYRKDREGSRYFYSLDKFKEEAQLHSFMLVTPEQADELERQIKLAHEHGKASKKAKKEAAEV